MLSFIQQHSLHQVIATDGRLHSRLLETPANIAISEPNGELRKMLWYLSRLVVFRSHQIS